METPVLMCYWFTDFTIRTYYGCGTKFTQAAKGGLPVPQLDLILKCNKYYDNAAISIQEKWNWNALYYSNQSCIT